MDEVDYNPPQDNQSKSVRYDQGISYVQMNSRTKLILPFVIR